MSCLLYRASIDAVIRLYVQEHELPSANCTKNSFAEASSHTPSEPGAEVQKQGEGEASFSSSNSTAHTTHCSTGTTHSLQRSHCFPYPQPHSSPVTLGLLLLHNNAQAHQQCSFYPKARLALVLLTIHSSGSRHWDHKGSAETSTFKVLTSHVPTILLENTSLGCCSCSPPRPHVQ